MLKSVGNDDYLEVNETYVFDKDGHWHCTQCWGKDFFMKDGQPLCSSVGCGSTRKPILCYPAICGSS
jgi:hypothetical protein